MDIGDITDPSDTAECGIKAQPEPELQEQAGGRIITIAGLPVAAKSLHEETMNAYAWLAGYYPWLGPLAEAAIIEGIQGAGEGRALFVTPYGDDGTDTFTDAEKHSAYVAHVRDWVKQYQPWFWPMLDAARAFVLISPQDGFTIAVRSRPGAQWDVYGLKEATALTPFADAAEIAH